jgi:hypothetical protein
MMIWTAMFNSVFQIGSFLEAQTATAKDGIDPSRLAYVERLILKPSDIVPWDSDLNNNDEVARERKRLSEVELKRMREIKSSADLKPYLFFLLDQYYAKDKSPDVAQVLSAVGLRDDLTEAEMTPIKNEIRAIIKSPHDSYNALNNFYLIGAAQVLGAKKSQENEDLALAILNRARDPSYPGLIVMPAEALSRIGTPRSIPSIESAINWLQEVADKTNDESSRQAAFRVRRSLKALKKNTGVSETSIIGVSDGMQDLSPPEITVTSPESSQPPSENTASTPWSVVVVLIAAALGLLWLMLKNRK